jgi:hypothetical protein
MQSWNSSLRVLCACFFLLLIGVSSAQSQGRVADYKVEQFSGAFTTIAGSASSWSTYDTWGFNYGISLPFNFPYDGGTISSGTTIYATGRGAIALSSTLPPSWTSSIQGSQSYPRMLNFFQGTMSVGDRHNGYVTHYWQQSGTSPNRVLTIELRSVHTVGAAQGWGSGPSNYSTDIQVKLYETGVIEYIYSQPGRSLGGSWYGYPSIGLNGASSPSFSFKTVQTGVTSVPSQHIRFTPPPPPAQMSLQPKSLAFGSVVSGSPVTMCATIRSVGANPLVITSTALAGTADFKIASGPANGTVIAPGGSASICVSFNPLASGSRTATLTVNSNGADSGSQQVVLSGFGVAPGIAMSDAGIFRKTNVTVGDSVWASVPFQSTGTGPLTITSVTLQGEDLSAYSIRYAPKTAIPVGAWDSIVVTFKPQNEGRADVTVNVNNNSINNPLVKIRTYGIGIIPRLQITPQNLAFDSVFIGESVCRDIALYNPGSDTVNITRMVTTFADADFSITPLKSGDTMIRPLEEKRFTVCFAPKSIGTRVATIRLNTDLRKTIPDGRDTSQFVINIMGTGVPFGRVALSGTENNAIVGIQQCVNDTLWNEGTASITVTSATLAGVDANEYSITGLTTPFTLGPGQARPFSYCLNPTARGARDGSLSLTTISEGQTKSGLLPLMGMGMLVCAQPDMTEAFPQEMVNVGESKTATITVTNCGDLSTTYTASLSTGASSYSINGATTSPNVDPNGTTSFEIAYNPTAIGANNATLTITGNGPGAQPMIIQLGGIGAGVTASSTGGNAGNVIVNECEDITVVVTNNGNVDWTPGTATISGANAADFSFVSMNPTTIAAGSTGTLTMRYCPKAEGNGTASVTFPNASPEPIAAFSINLSGRGVQGGRVSTRSEMNGFILGQNHPNPISGQAEFSVTIPRETLVRIDLFDAKGAFVRTVVSERMNGKQTLSLDATALPAGTYSYVLTADEVRLVRQMIVVR